MKLILYMFKKTILIVEDERSLANAISKKLNLSGFVTIIVDSVPAAENVLVKQAVDLIWLDHYLLGKQSGLDFVANLKTEESIWNKIPIFVVSNTASPEKVTAYLSLGVNKYYIKANSRLEDIISDINSQLNIKK